MSKPNNRNPNYYDDGTRHHQGEGIIHDEHKHKLNEEKRTDGKEGQPNFIPGEKPVGEKPK